MKNIKAVFYKQILDTVKNKAILIQFFMFPMMAIIMETSVKIEDMPEHFFVKMFAAMFVGMAPLICMSSIISEEKEKNTLRTLMMSGVKSWQYLVSIGAYIFMMCMVGTAVLAILGKYEGRRLAVFFAVMAAGILVSELTGAVIGIYSRNQMAATSVTVPVMMIFSFLPMISLFNKGIRKIAEIIWSQQISNLINGIDEADISSKSVIVIALNYTVAIVLFAAVYRRKGLE